MATAQDIIRGKQRDAMVPGHFDVHGEQTVRKRVPVCLEPDCVGSYSTVVA